MNLEYVKDSIGSNDKVISRKIQKYKQSDKKKNRKITNDYVTIEDVINLLIKQDNKCYVCHDNVIIKEWYPECLYQFTLDRINTNLPHNKNNVLISCYYCNCYSHLPDKVSDICCNKICRRGCHTIKRNILRTRYDVPMTEIINLLLDCSIKLSDCTVKLEDNDKKLRHYNMAYNFIKIEDNDEEELFEISDNDEELFEIEIDDRIYYATHEENGILYEVTSDGDVGYPVGIIKDGKPIIKL
jgi:hypothetical protein